MKKKITIECTGYYEFTFDPDSKEFKDSLESYQQSIEKGGSAESMIIHCAHNLRRSEDVSSMIEGVGYLMKEGREQPKELWSGITVDDDDPDFNYEKY